MTASEIAYQSVKPKADSIQGIILGKISDYATIKEMERALTIYAPSTISTRFSELEEKGLIYKTSEIRGGYTVWKVTPLEQIIERQKAVRMQRYHKWLREGSKFVDLMNSQGGGLLRGFLTEYAVNNAMGKN